MTQLTLSLQSARALHLAAQGLLHAPRQPADPAALSEMIRRMGVLQIDTISVVARSPYLVLWSRLGAYPHNWLEGLLAEGNVFEYWAHEACFIPTEDYRLFRHRMLDPASMGWKYSVNWMRDNQPQVDAVLAHIRQHGACKSSDFARTDGKAGGWWSWKPEKRSLEVLYTSGHLMIAKRHNFQRIYDLTERVLPDWDDAQLPSLAQTEHELQLKAVKALGIARPEWLGDYYRNAKTKPRPDPKTLVARGELLNIKVDGWEQECYLHPEHLELAQLAAEGQLKSSVTTLLSPFDPVVWDRKRALDLFNFDYRLECYTPAHLRRFGYFCLPILHAGKLIGRLDAKAHRQKKIMEIKSLYLEKGVRESQGLAKSLAKTLTQFTHWHACETIELISTQETQTLSSDFLQRIRDSFELQSRKIE